MAVSAAALTPLVTLRITPEMFAVAADPLTLRLLAKLRRVGGAGAGCAVAQVCVWLHPPTNPPTHTHAACFSPGIDACKPALHWRRQWALQRGRAASRSTGSSC